MFSENILILIPISDNFVRNLMAYRQVVPVIGTKTSFLGRQLEFHYPLSIQNNDNLFEFILILFEFA